MFIKTMILIYWVRESVAVVVFARSANSFHNVVSDGASSVVAHAAYAAAIVASDFVAVIVARLVVVV